MRINIYKYHGYFAPETADDLISAVAGEDTPLPREILNRFVSRYRTQAGTLPAWGRRRPGLGGRPGDGTHLSCRRLLVVAA